MKQLLFLLCFAFSQVSASTIHVIGDSHSLEFTGIPGLSIRHIGPITMHRVGRDQLDAIDLDAIGIEDGDTIIFSIGEIDVRCHIAKQRDLNNRDLDEIIHTLANAYVQTLLKIKSRYDNLNCIIYSITPPTDITNDPQYPRQGSLEDRVKIARHLNNLLKTLCSLNNIKFLDVYESYADDDGVLIVELSDGGVHISEKYNEPIRKKLEILLRN